MSVIKVIRLSYSVYVKLCYCIILLCLHVACIVAFASILVFFYGLSNICVNPFGPKCGISRGPPLHIRTKRDLSR